MTHALLAAGDLRAELDAADPPLLVDVRWSLTGSDPAGYAEGHLPGAVFADLDEDLADPPGPGGRHPLPSPERMTRTLRRLGVMPDRDVVVYDGGSGAAAARAWWCLRWAGHARVRVLDGGLPAWIAAGGPLERGEVEPVAAPQAVARPGGMPVVDVDQVGSGAGPLLDARAAERFRGEVEPVDPVAGHIPGAASCPTAALQHDDGRYLDPARLRSVLTAALGRADVGGTPIAYCGSGVTASQVVLAGCEVGLPIALYPGSWSHWVQDPARPVATGA